MFVWNLDNKSNTAVLRKLCTALLYFHFLSQHRPVRYEILHISHMGNTSHYFCLDNKSNTVNSLGVLHCNGESPIPVTTQCRDNALIFVTLLLTQGTPNSVLANALVFVRTGQYPIPHPSNSPPFTLNPSYFFILLSTSYV